MRGFHNRAVSRIRPGQRGAVLFTGPRGLYQMEDALTLAEKVLGEDALDHPDLMLYQNGKERIGIEVIEEISANLTLVPARAERRVVILEGAECLSPVAQNKFLKVLEEGDAFFILISYGEMLPTVKSRAMQVAFRPLPYQTFHEMTGGDETLYYVTGGCPQLTDERNICGVFEKCGDAVKRKSAKELFQVLHMVREKDRTSFYNTNKGDMAALFAYFGKCMEMDYSKALAAAEASIRCTGPAYMEADFFKDLAELVS